MTSRRAARLAALAALSCSLSRRARKQEADHDPPNRGLGRWKLSLRALRAELPI